MTRVELEKKISMLEEERTVLSYKTIWTGNDYVVNRHLGDLLIKYRAQLNSIEK